MNAPARDMEVIIRLSAGIGAILLILACRGDLKSWNTYFNVCGYYDRNKYPENYWIYVDAKAIAAGLCAIVAIGLIHIPVDRLYR